MKEYVVTPHPLTSGISDTTEDDFLDNCRRLLEYDGAVDIELLTMILLVRFVGVAHYEARSKNTGQIISGWIVGGNMPFLVFNDDEIKHAMEALALYCWFLKPWLESHGKDTKTSSVPRYRLPPDWENLEVDPGYRESRLGAITGFIEWKLIPRYESEIVHPEIRDRCIRRGWIRPWTSAK